MNSRTTERMLQLVRLERQRQQVLLDRGDINFNCADPEISDLVKFPVLVEEVGEVATEIQFPPVDKKKLQKELIQAAAVAVAWAESLEDES